MANLQINLKLENSTIKETSEIEESVFRKTIKLWHDFFKTEVDSVIGKVEFLDDEAKESLKAKYEDLQKTNERRMLTSRITRFVKSLKQVTNSEKCEILTTATSSEDIEQKFASLAPDLTTENLLNDPNIKEHLFKNMVETSLIHGYSDTKNTLGITGYKFSFDHDLSYTIKLSINSNSDDIARPHNGLLKKLYSELELIDYDRMAIQGMRDKSARLTLVNNEIGSYSAEISTKINFIVRGNRKYEYANKETIDEILMGFVKTSEYRACSDVLKKKRLFDERERLASKFQYDDEDFAITRIQEAIRVKLVNFIKNNTPGAINSSISYSFNKFT